MANIELVNFEQHTELRVDTGFSTHFDDIGPVVTILASEAPQLSLDFPMFITKNAETGEFELSAVMGFFEKENLFIANGKWRAAFVPLNICRQPFQAVIIGEGETTSDIEPDQDIKIGVNTKSNRLSTSDGERLFEADGRPTAYLSKISEILGELLTGSRSTRQFLTTLADLNLIETVALTIQLDNGQKNSFDGLYRVNDKKLADLDEAIVIDFHRRGYFQAIYALLHSEGHLKKLIDWKNQENT